MANKINKKKTMENERVPLDDVQPEAIELPAPIEKATPSLINVKTETLKLGYVFARLIGSDSIIQIPAKQVGKAFTEDKWEILSDKKK